jgi:hypothetical protein
MNLTLLIDDLEQDIFVTNVNSIYPIHELIYLFNNVANVNYIREHLPLSVKRKKETLQFDLFYNRDNDGNVSYIVSNTTFADFNTVGSGSLFDDVETLEMKHVLLNSLKKYNYLIVSSGKDFSDQFKRVKLAQIFNTRHINEFNKKEQNIIQNIYYEKQG